MRNTEQDNLKYQKLYHWAHTLITSGVIKNMDKFPSETIPVSYTHLTLPTT